MTRATIVGAALALVLLILVLAAAFEALEQDVRAVTPPAMSPSGEVPVSDPDAGCIYGRITVDGGAVYEGRLRWDDEAFWGDAFNGAKDENPWAAHVPAERLIERYPFEIFGIEIAQRERPVELGRPFMARFGDIARIEAEGRDLRVILKSGTVFPLDRFDADDLADGVRVGDGPGAVDLDEWPIRTIELLATPRPGAALGRLHGTVHTRQGAFTGLLQWNREKGLVSDEIVGRAAGAELHLRFDAIRSIARHSRDSVVVTRLDGQQIELSGSRDVGPGHRGIHVDDRRYGRVLVSWNAVERVDLGPGGSGPPYGDYPPGSPITGEVTTRGRRLAGRLVYDLDESETTETLDAPFAGVHYMIPFGLIASIVPAGGEGGAAESAEITLHGGERLPLEAAGDLGDGNLGLLVFVEGRERPEYVAWTDAERIELDRPAAMYPPMAER